MPLLMIQLAGGYLPVQMPNISGPQPIGNVLHPEFGFAAIVDAKTLQPAEMATFKAAPCTMNLCPVHQFGTLIDFNFEGDEENGMPPLNLRVVHSAVVQRIVDRIDASTMLKAGLHIRLIAIDYGAAEVVALRGALMNERMARAWAKHAKRQVQAMHLFRVDDFIQDVGRTVDTLPVPLPKELAIGGVRLVTSHRAATQAVADVEG